MVFASSSQSAPGGATVLYADHKVDRSGAKLEGFLEKTAKYTKSWVKRFVTFDPATRELAYGESPVKMKATLRVTSVVRASEEDAAMDVASPALLSFVVSSTDDGHSLGIRCPDRATFHAWYFPIRHSLSKAKLMPDFDAGLPGRDPRTGLRFARVPPEFLFRFHLMDKAVLTLFTAVTLPTDEWLVANSATKVPAAAAAAAATKAAAADPGSVPEPEVPKRRARTKTFFQRFTAPDDDDEVAPTSAPPSNGSAAGTPPAAPAPTGERVLLLVINRHLYLFRPTTQIVRCIEIEFIGAIFTGARCLGVATQNPERDLFVSDCDDVSKVVEVLQAVSAFTREDKGDRLRVRMTQSSPAAVVRELDFQSISESVAAAAAKPVPPTPKAALKAAMDKAIADSSDDDDDDDDGGGGGAGGSSAAKKEDAGVKKEDATKSNGKLHASPTSEKHEPQSKAAAAAPTSGKGAAIPVSDLDEFL